MVVIPLFDLFPSSVLFDPASPGFILLLAAVSSAGYDCRF